MTDRYAVAECRRLGLAQPDPGSPVPGNDVGTR